MSGLNDLALKYKTDKSSWGHNYTAVYDHLFTPIRNKPIKFLEVGIQQGYSLRTWRDWFPNATIYGVDIRNKWVDRFKDEERIITERVDQSSAEQLTEFAKKGPWRVIIDDGSHHSHDQKLTFDVLWDQVEPGGYYIIEDTHTSYHKNFVKTEKETLIQRMLRLTDEICSTPSYFRGAFNKYWVKKEVEDLTQHQKEIEYVQFRLGLIVIKKRGKVEDYGKP
jgi:hypothetical protein